MADNEKTRQPPQQQLSTPSSANGTGNINTAQQNPVKKRKINLLGTPGMLYTHISIYPIRSGLACSLQLLLRISLSDTAILDILSLEIKMLPVQDMLPAVRIRHITYTFLHIHGLMAYE